MRGMRHEQAKGGWKMAGNSGEDLQEKKALTTEELEEQNRQLLEENERLKREREEYRKTLPMKERLYDHVNVSLKTMDRIIAVLFILLGIVLAMGIINR